MRRILLMLLAMALLFLASCSSPEAQPPVAEPPAAEPPAADAPGTDASNQEPEIVYVDPEKAYTIYVNDEKIAQSATCTNGYIEFPVIAVLRALGATVNWSSNQDVTILYNKQIFTINITDEMMYHGEEPILEPFVLGGGPYMPVFRVIGEEIFIDNAQLFNFFCKYTDVVITNNHTEKEVYIKEESGL